MGEAHDRARAGDLEAAETPTPCLKDGCRCCALWTEALERLNESIQRHTAGELRIAPCDEDCLVCAQIDWQAREAPEPA